ncbi:MAG: ATP-binding cassette domain-containing protein [Verrucomicrobiales bacterium]|nr:ATP-binding cassette domain-containing protein [Verrucomicrobiales bacterium]
MTLPALHSLTRSQILKVSHLSVVRDGRAILRDVEWEVCRGEHWAVLGANGSGKTSLLNVVLGYLTATTGTVQIRGRDATEDGAAEDWDTWRKQIGFVSSSIAGLIDPDETAHEIVMAGRHAMVNYWRQQRTPEEEIAAAHQILERIECSHLARQPWRYLSQGERQRILIGRALMSPDLKMLVLDEPCAGLDPVAREHFVAFVERLISRKRNAPTLLLVTHHVEEIMPSVTHALILKDGQVIAAGEKSQSLRSATLTQAFGTELMLRRYHGRYRLYHLEEAGSEVV